MSTHENSRQRRHVRADLPLRAPRRGSGKYETIPFHPPPPAAPVKHGFGGSRSTRLVALTSFGFIVGLCRFRRLSLGVVRLRQFPSRNALQHTVGVLDGVHVSIVAFNHEDRSSHLLGEEIHVYSFLQSERGVGMPETIR